MTNTVIAFSLSIAPWILGIAMLYGLLYQRGQWHLPHHLFAIGSAAYMGYAWMALLMAGLQRYTLPVFSDWILAWMALSVAVCWGLGTLARLKTAEHSGTIQDSKSVRNIKQQEPWWLVLGLTAWLLSLTVSVWWEAALRPATAWDTLSYWTYDARIFLHDQFNGELEAMRSRTHPVLIKYVGAWGAFALHERSPSNLYLPWAALYFSITLVCIALGKLLTGRWWLGLTAAMLLVSSPLLQAHAALGGYADLWLAAGLFLCVAWLAVASQRGFKPKTIPLILIGLLIVNLTYVKGNAAVYALILLSAMLLAWALTKWHWTAILGLIATGAFVVFWAWSNGIDLTFLGYRFAFLPEESQVALGRRQAVLANNSWVEIGRNFWHVWGQNSSFYLAGMLVVTFVVLPIWQQSLRHGYSLLVGILLCIGLVMFFGFAQHFSEGEFFTHSSPQSDTGLSRFSQTMYFAFIFIFTVYISILSPQE